MDYSLIIKKIGYDDASIKMISEIINYFKCSLYENDNKIYLNINGVSEEINEKIINATNILNVHTQINKEYTLICFNLKMIKDIQNNNIMQYSEYGGFNTFHTNYINKYTYEKIKLLEIEIDLLKQKNIKIE